MPESCCHNSALTKKVLPGDFDFEILNYFYCSILWAVSAARTSILVAECGSQCHKHNSDEQHTMHSCSWEKPPLVVWYWYLCGVYSVGRERTFLGRLGRRWEAFQRWEGVFWCELYMLQHYSHWNFLIICTRVHTHTHTRIYTHKHTFCIYYIGMCVYIYTYIYSQRVLCVCVYCIHTDCIIYIYSLFVCVIIHIPTQTQLLKILHFR